jgi:hypothetical protein
MNTKNYFLLLVLTAIIGLGCRKQIQEPTLTPQLNQNSFTTASQSIDYLSNDFILKSENLRAKFNSETNIGTGVFGLDSAIIYLRAAVNIQMGNANVFAVEHERFVHRINLAETSSLTEQNLKTYFSMVKSFASTSLESVNYPDKAIKYVMIDVIDEEFDVNKYLNITIMVGRKNYNPIWITGAMGKNDYQYFNPNISYRFNYNGGACGEQPYFAPLDYGGTRASVHRDMHGVWRGFHYGGAKELEKAINSSYSALTLKNANGDNRITCPTGKKIVYLVFPTYSIVLPKDVINTNNNINSKLNPTDIYSYNEWNTSLHDNLPCIMGNEMNFYLGKAMTIIDNNLIKMLPGYTFADCHVHSGYKVYQGGTTPIPLAAVRLGSFIVNGINREEYFSHRYNLISTTPTVVTDPSAQ